MEKDLKDLLIDELRDILSSEEQIVEALPDMVKAAESPDLKKAFESHLKETRGQIQRLQKIFKLLKIEKKEKFCKATKGLIQECKEVLKDYKTKSPIRDAALISKAQRIEHYEISAYGTVRTFAKEIDQDAVANLLQETLNEEEHADKKLTKIAEGGLFKSGINQQAILPITSKSKESKKPGSSPKKSTTAPKHKASTTHKAAIAPKSKASATITPKRKPSAVKSRTKINAKK